MSRGIYRRLRSVAGVLLLGVSLLLVACSDSSKLRVVALNVEWYPGQSPEPTEDEIANHTEAVEAALASLKPDLLIATEVCDADAFRDVVAKSTGLDLHVISNYRRFSENPDDRNQQIGIASRLAAEAGWAEEWDKGTIPDLSRGFSFAALRNPRNNHLIMVYGLHLKSNRSRTPEEEQRNYDMRDESIKQLLGHVKKMEEQFADQVIDGWIVAGDFNTNHDGRFGDHVIEMLTDAGFHNTWEGVEPRKRYTWRASGKFKSTTFDYIMTRGFGKPTARAIEMYQSVSDHNAVVLTIKLPKE